MFQIVLFEPEIPPNTGNIIRLCANSGSTLHLIHPLGFQLDEKSVRRAGMDYSELAGVSEYADLGEYLDRQRPQRLFACSTRGGRTYSQVAFAPGDALLFGPETRGLPQTVLAQLAPEQRICIPMCAGNRSLNLSNAAAVIVYEAWRQQGFAGAAGG